MIEVKNLSKSFYIHQKKPGLLSSLSSLFSREKIEKKALQNINLKVDKGEILGLIGANGAGKTTLVKILSGIIHPTQGEVDVLGFNPWDRNNEYRKQMALIMGQKAQVWWDLPALDSFLLLKEIYQIPTKQYKQTLEFLASTLNVQSHLKTQVRKLSLGERMKIELMAALLHRPKVIFLDEPTIGLDITSQKAVRNFLKEYKEQFNPIMILTSHYMEDISQLCERVTIMREGEIVYNGKLEDVQTKFGETRILSVIMEQDFESLKKMQNLSQDLGEVLYFQDGILKVKVEKKNVPHVSQMLLENFKIHDLTIQDTEIADLIEKIMLKES